MESMEGMEEMPQADVSHLPSTPALAALASLSADLQAVLGALEELLSGRHEDSEVVRRALWNQALMMYARCFNGGLRSVRLTLDDVEALGEGAREAHEYFFSMRNKHIAHSVNAFEDMRVAVVIDPRPTPHVDGVAVLHFSRVGEMEETIRSLQRMAFGLLQVVNERAQEQQDRVMEEASREDVNALLARGPIRLVAPSINVAGVPRDRPQ